MSEFKTGIFKYNNKLIKICDVYKRGSRFVIVMMFKANGFSCICKVSSGEYQPNYIPLYNKSGTRGKDYDCLISYLNPTKIYLLAEDFIEQTEEEVK